MSYTLEQFAGQCHEILKDEPGPGGRRKVVALLETVLKDDEFTAATVPEGIPARQILYEDPELGFCILAHGYDGASNSSPHDHGPTWAIYGQASGETEMTEWEIVEAAETDKPGKAKVTKIYKMSPGMAQAYDEGDLHSPRREDSTRLIRIEGKNMDGVARLPYEPV